LWAEEIFRDEDLNLGAIFLQGMTSLHYAAARGSLAIVKVLVKYKAPLDAQDGAGMAPLHAAVIHDRHLPALICQVPFNLRAPPKPHPRRLTLFVGVQSRSSGDVGGVGMQRGRGGRAGIHAAASCRRVGAAVDGAGSRRSRCARSPAPAVPHKLLQIRIRCRASCCNRSFSTTNTHGKRLSFFHTPQKNAPAGHTPIPDTNLGRKP
jgi:hypothetical protein